MEVLIVIAIMGLIAALLIFSFVGLGSHQTLEQEVANVTALLEEARTHTLSSRFASPYGVALSEEAAVLFRGGSLSEADEILREHRLADSVRIDSIALDDGSEEVVFTRLFGEASTAGTIQLISVRQGTARSIVVFRSGFVE